MCNKKSTTPSVYVVFVYCKIKFLVGLEMKQTNIQLHYLSLIGFIVFEQSYSLTKQNQLITEHSSHIYELYLCVEVHISLKL